MPKKGTFLKAVRVLLIFLHLELTLYSVLLRPEIKPQVKWVPMSLFKADRFIEYKGQIQERPFIWLEATVYSLIALLGYFFGYNNIVSLKNFDKDAPTLCDGTFSITQKYYWVAFMPWIIKCVEHLIRNIVNYSTFFKHDVFYSGGNIMIAILIAFFTTVVQALLCCEVIALAIRGYRTMRFMNTLSGNFELWTRALFADRLTNIFGF